MSATSIAERLRVAMGARVGYPPAAFAPGGVFTDYRQQ